MLDSTNTGGVWAHSFCLNSGTYTSTNIITFVLDDLEAELLADPVSAT